MVMVKNIHKFCMRVQMIIAQSKIKASCKLVITQRESDVSHHCG